MSEVKNYASAADALHLWMRQKLVDPRSLSVADAALLVAAAEHVAREYQSARRLAGMYRQVLEGSATGTLEWARRSLTTPGTEQSARIHATLGTISDALRAADETEAALASSAALVMRFLSDKGLPTEAKPVDNVVTGEFGGGKPGA